jgi:peptidoglycan hydrolase CwlO-like protein
MEEKSNKQNILFYIVIGLCIYNIFNVKGIKTDINGYKNNIENIQKKVDSAKTVNTKIGYKIDSVKQKVVTINRDIHHIDKTITIVKQNTNEKSNSINKFSNPELEYFFTNRYNKTITGNQN